MKKVKKLSNYEYDCMWMSYRYCIGRSTIAAHSHAGSIWEHCGGRLNDEDALFTSKDINHEIVNVLRAFMKPKFHFMRMFEDKHGTAVDIICEFISEYNIKSKKELLEYKEVKVIQTDNERGYKFETTTWEEWLRETVHQRLIKHYQNNSFTHEQTWGIFKRWQNYGEAPYKEVENIFNDIVKDMPNPDIFFMTDFEDLFVWSTLANLFNPNRHHKSVLKDGTEIEWVWGWHYNMEKVKDTDTYRKSFGYHKIRIPVNAWNGVLPVFIPKDVIKTDLY